MRTTLFLLSIIVACGMVSAQDTTATSAPAPALAAEPVVAPAPAPIVAPAPAAPILAWSGLAMLRLRDEMLFNKLQTGKKEESATFSYQIAYKVGLKANPSKNVLLQFELGNDWYATEEALGIPGNYYTKRDPMTPWFSLAYAQWDPGYMHIQAGIIPVRGTPLMDLLGVSLFFDRSYKMAAHLPWGVVTNFSQTGLRLGTPIVKGPITVGVDAMSAIIQQRYIKVGLDTLKLNPAAVEFELEAPITADALTVTPQVFIIPNRSYYKGTGKSDMELGVGLDGGYKVSDDLKFRAGFGYAQNSNKKSFAANNIPDTIEFDRSGINANVGSTIKLGPGKVDVDFNVSTEKNKLDTKVNDLYGFADLKYGWALEKNFVLMPRIRFFYTKPKADATAYSSKLTVRPELIFAGSF